MNNYSLDRLSGDTSKMVTLHLQVTYSTPVLMKFEYLQENDKRFLINKLASEILMYKIKL